jgi:hypothetical protein
MSKLGKYGFTTIIQNNFNTFLYSHRALRTTLTEQLHRKSRGGASLPLVGFIGNGGVITGELTRPLVDPEDV